MEIIYLYLAFSLITSITAYIVVYLKVLDLVKYNHPENIMVEMPILASITFMVMAFIMSPIIVVVLFTAPDTFIHSMAEGIIQK
jgi:hypothetical protein